MIVFLYPLALFLLIVPWIVRLLFASRRAQDGDALRVPMIEDFAQIGQAAEARNSVTPFRNADFTFFALLYAAWIFLVIAAMRPILYGEPVPLKTEGRDILLISDISTSMREPDFAYQGYRLDRLTAVKVVVSDFVKKRLNDRLGLILFGTQAYLQAPLTHDRQTVLEVLQSADAGMAGDSTAIGNALMLALKALQQAGATDRKVIILLTDGENNDGVPMAQAMDAVRQAGVTVYTIGVGQARRSLMSSFFGIQTPDMGDADLKRLAAETDGRYFQASDLKGLAEVYRQIDRLEPEETEERFYRPSVELFFYPLLVALLLAGLWGLKVGERK